MTSPRTMPRSTEPAATRLSSLLSLVAMWVVVPFLMALLPPVTAQYTGPPSPPPPPRPTWPRSVRTSTPGDSITAATSGTVTEDDGVPWWWLLVATTGSMTLVIVVASVCLCVCFKPSGRRRGVASQEGGASEEGGVNGSMPRDFRRMNSSAAKRYLLNVVSVLSWGSDFELSASRPQSQMYANPQALPLGHPPPRPPKPAPAGSSLYANVNSLAPP